MAVTVITPIKLVLNEIVKETAATDFVALHATDGAEFVMPARDEKYVIGLKNAAVSSVNVTAIIKAGDGLQSAFGDIQITLAQNNIAWVAIDSGRFKNHLGNNKGKVIIKSLAANGEDGSADLQVKVIQLP